MSARASIEAQPDTTTCGPTCLHALYRHFGDDVDLDEVVDTIHRLDHGGTLDVFLANHALNRGYSAGIWTYNLEVFDPSWFVGKVDLPAKLGAQMEAKKDRRLHVATRGYLDFLKLGARTRKARFDLAMLVNPAEAHPPSDEKALLRFERAGAELGFQVERITPDDIGRLAEFDALFIRETTAVNHHTFRFAHKATAEGLVVIDDPDSILKCTNKVYLAELLARHNVPAPKTLLVHRDNVDEIEKQLGLPVVLKQPDSAFSVGVVKVLEPAELKPAVRRLLKSSELIVAQEYLPTTFDWRVGIIDGRPLYVCRYHMARGHWQIIKHDGETGSDEGNVDTLAIGEAPDIVIKTALKAASLIGNGLYGVDLKEADGKVRVIEVNDNPSIDAGIEDEVLKGALYREILGVILKRVEEIKKDNRH